MICVVQRVLQAEVTVAGESVGKIGRGMLALAAVQRSDTAREIDWMAGKLAGLRIFQNGDKHFDFDVQQIGGSILLVSNFTVSAATGKGRRPSFDAAMPPELAEPVFDQLVAAVKKLGVPVETGRFGASMQVSLVNDGPATFLISTAVPDRA